MLTKQITVTEPPWPLKAGAKVQQALQLIHRVELEGIQKLDFIVLQQSVIESSLTGKVLTISSIGFFFFFLILNSVKRIKDISEDEILSS